MEKPNSQLSPNSNSRESAIGHGKLATRVDRLLGVLIDGAVMLIPMIIVYVIMAIVLGLLGVEGTTFIGRAILNIVGGVIGVALFVAINFRFLSKGQTVGKLVIGTRIVADDGSLIPVDQLIVKRYLIIWGASVLISTIVPLLGIITIVDPLMIFRENHKCLHDELAGSKVISLK
jgi:uncharacterized RDD family membrane protein YckC